MSCRATHNPSPVINIVNADAIFHKRIIKRVNNDVCGENSTDIQCLIRQSAGYETAYSSKPLQYRINMFVARYILYVSVSFTKVTLGSRTR